MQCDTMKLSNEGISISDPLESVDVNQFCINLFFSQLLLAHQNILAAVVI